MTKVVVPQSQTWEVVQKQAVTRWIPEPTQEPSADWLGLTVAGAIGGLGGYALGKKHGHNDGYNQAKTEDSETIRQLQQSLQKANVALYTVHKSLSERGQEREKYLQEIQRLRSENEILKTLVPASSQTEAILKALHKVEFRLMEFLPSQFEDGGNGQDQKLN